jgi:hypothetical protein
MPTPLFSNTALYFNAMVLAPNALVATYSKADPKVPENVTWYVGALNRTTGATLWEIALPDVPGTTLKGAPLHQGLAIDRNGNVIVTLYNGNVLCYGAGAVSVRAAGETMPVATVPQSAITVAASYASPQSPLNSQPSLTDQTAPAPSAACSPAVDQAGATKASTGAAVLELPELAQHDATDRSDMAEVNGVPTHTLSPAERVAACTYKPRSTRWLPERECLPVAAVSASSSNRACRPGATIDRDLTSRWQAAAAGKQWIVYDLGSVQTVQAMTLVWYAAKQTNTAFALESSLDGKQFSQVDAGVLTGRGTSTTLRTFMPREARYVRVTLDSPVSLYEVGVHGPSSAESRAAARQ